MTTQARAMISALAKHGVAQVVASPGSRNAPLTMALAAQSAIQLHMRFDERTAGFTALGMAKASGRPVAVVVTSGTAVANLAPAVYEAHEAGVPLIVITADRPPAVRGKGANQTIEQFGLFSLAVRAEWDLPLAEARAEQYWELAIANAVGEAMGDSFTAPGPVHLNVPFAEPLVPDEDATEWAASVIVGPAPVPRPTEPVELLPLLRDLKLDHAPVKGVVITSDLGASRQLVALARLLGWPVLSEPGGGARDSEVGIQHYARLLADVAFRAEHRADLVITAGRFALSRAVAAYVKEAVNHIAVGRFPLDADPFETAQHHVAQVPMPIGVAPADPQWLQQWRAADSAAVSGVAGWNSRAAVRELCQQLTSQDTLWVSASQAIRLVDDALPCAPNAPQVFMNRGVNGIDGVIASASGAALGDPSRNTWLLIGDVATLHDLSSLALPATEQRPRLRILVLDNSGGAIFQSLEQGAPEHAAVFDKVFGTPHAVDLVAVCAALGWSAVSVSSEVELRAALAGEVDVVVARLPRLG